MEFLCFLSVCRDKTRTKCTFLVVSTRKKRRYCIYDMVWTLQFEHKEKAFESQQLSPPCLCQLTRPKQFTISTISICAPWFTSPFIWLTYPTSHLLPFYISIFILNQPSHLPTTLSLSLSLSLLCIIYTHTFPFTPISQHGHKPSPPKPSLHF